MRYHIRLKSYGDEITHLVTIPERCADQFPYSNTVIHTDKIGSITFPGFREAPYKIYMLGDSWLENMFIPEGSRMTDIMNIMLQKYSGKYCVYNFGMSGSSILHQYNLFLNKLCAAPENSLAVVFFGSITATNNNRLGTHWNLGPMGPFTEHNNEVPTIKGDKSFESTKKIVRIFAHTAREFNYPLVFALTPFKSSSHWLGELNDALRSCYLENDLPFIDLSTILEDRDHLFYDGVHCNQQGAYFYATALVHELLEHLPDCIRVPDRFHPLPGRSVQDLPRVKLAAFVAGGNPMLPVFIYHHFYFGADAIEIIASGLNETEREMLERLQTVYPGLKVTYFDWLEQEMRSEDMHFSLRDSAWQYVHDNSRQDCDYLLFLNADEFYMPANCKESMGELIRALKWPDAVALEDFGAGMQKMALIPSLCAAAYFCRSAHEIKTLFRSGLKVETMTPGRIHFNAIETYVFPDGSKPRYPSPAADTLLNEGSSLKRAFILHAAENSVISVLAAIARKAEMTREDGNGEISLPEAGVSWPFYGRNSDSRFVNSLPDDYYKGFAELCGKLDLQPCLIKCLVGQYLLALEGLRYLNLSPAAPIALKIKEEFGEFVAIRQKILENLDILGYPAQDLP